MKYKVRRSLSHTFQQKSLANSPSKIWTFQVFIAMEAIYVSNPEKHHEQVVIFLIQSLIHLMNFVTE